MLGKHIFFRLGFLAPGAQVPISWVKLESLEKKKKPTRSVL